LPGLGDDYQKSLRATAPTDIGYLPPVKTKYNPDNLAVGFVKDDQACLSCHAIKPRDADVNAATVISLWPPFNYKVDPKPAVDAACRPSETRQLADVKIPPLVGKPMGPKAGQSLEGKHPSPPLGLADSNFVMLFDFIDFFLVTPLSAGVHLIDQVVEKVDPGLRRYDGERA
jgi:hypothetical protein